jgi:site-specific DNA-methyltransferase (adenine-specific)
MIQTRIPVEPFYDQDGITIYNADCRKLLPWLEIDRVVTDPPYGISFAGKRQGTDPVNETPYDQYLDSVENFAKIVVPVIALSCQIAKTVATFCPVRHIGMMPVPSDAGGIWQENGKGLSPFGFTSLHAVLYYGEDPKRQGRVGGSWPTGFRHDGKATVCKQHPCSKPVEWMRWLINRLSNEGDVIADLFMGAGTTLLAAKLEGRKAIGIEISKPYCKAAVDRLKQKTLW